MQEFKENSRIKELTIEKLRAKLENNIGLLESEEIEAIYLKSEDVILIPIYLYELYSSEVNSAKYQSNEIVSLQTFKTNTAFLLDKLREYKVDKVAIIYEDKLMLVVMRFKEYEQLKELFEKRENIDISKVIKERVNLFGGEVVYVSHEEMEELLNDQIAEFSKK